MLTDDDRRQLRQIGIEPAEAEHQLSLLREPPRYVELLRPCTIGDGIEALRPSEAPALLEAHAAAARRGRCLKFVPASGAASRMFRDLLVFQSGEGRELCWPAIERQAREGRPEAVALCEFLARARELPFYDQLQRTLFRRGEDLDGLAGVGAFQPVLDALLAPDGMDCAARPKGLLEFHAHPHGPRTAFEEHLAEAIDYVRDEAGTCRLHFTISPEHREAFVRLFDAVGPRLELGSGVQFQVGWSVQKPRTDTLAVEVGGEPLRDGDGRLRLRPGGHGALIENLDDLGGDIVFIKNIDNVQPEGRRALTVEWKKRLCGALLRLQQEVFDQLGRLAAPAATDAVIRDVEHWVAERLHVVLDGAKEPPSREARRACLIARLNRPLRACGVVANTGEPGGGPFWVRAPDGTTSLQIVESAQVDPLDRGQREIFGASTHFNPVDLVCGLRGANGEPFPLTDFVDAEAAIVTRKSEGGRDIRVLERPGLWNGGMAGWNTIFVEVPIETFTPVKTVLDLLRPEHGEPARGSR